MSRPLGFVGLILPLMCVLGPCACQGSEGGKPDVDERNGTRLKRLWLAEPGGSRMLAPGMFWDATTQKVCTLDSTREACIAEGEGVEEARYIDRECTKIGIAASVRVARLAKTCTSTYYETSSSAPTLEVPYRYAKIAGRCEVVEGQTTIRLPTGQLPTFTFSPGEGTGRLRPVIAESSDGLRVLGGVPIAFDTLTGEVCTLQGGGFCRYSGSSYLPRIGPNGQPESIEVRDRASQACRVPVTSRVVVVNRQTSMFVHLRCEEQDLYAPELRDPVSAALRWGPEALAESRALQPLRGPFFPAPAIVKRLEDGTVALVDSDGTWLSTVGMQGTRCKVSRGDDGTFACHPTFDFGLLAYEDADCAGKPVSAYLESECTTSPAALFPGSGGSKQLIASRADGDNLYIRGKAGCQRYVDERAERNPRHEHLVRVTFKTDLDDRPFTIIPPETAFPIPLETYVSKE